MAADEEMMTLARTRAQERLGFYILLYYLITVLLASLGDAGRDNQRVALADG